MTIGFGVGDIVKAIELANTVRKNFSDAPKQYQAFKPDIENLSIVLQNVKENIINNHIPTYEAADVDTIVSNCLGVLDDVEKAGRNDLKSRPRKVWDVITHNPEAIREMRDRISSCLNSLNTLLNRYTQSAVAGLTEKQDVLVEKQDVLVEKQDVLVEKQDVLVEKQDVLVEKQDVLIQQQSQRDEREILDWLSPSYIGRHTDHIRKRLHGTGQWLLDSEEYQKWVSSSKGEALALEGIPGAGKTISSAIVIDNLQSLHASDAQIGICYYYCDYSRQEEQQQLETLLLCFLRQLAATYPALPLHIRQLFERYYKTGQQMTLATIKDAIYTILKSLQRTYIVVDALDECPSADGCRRAFMAELADLHKTAGANVLVTFRPLPDIRNAFSNFASMEIRASKEDIGRYVDANIPKFAGFVRSDMRLQSQIKEAIIRASDGIFLLVTLQVGNLKGKLTRYAIREALARLNGGSQDRSGLYSETMKRICNQDHDHKELAMNTLTWIVYAQRPLTCHELLHALAVDTATSTFIEDNSPDIEEVLLACHGLVYMEETKVIRLIHRTTQEFFNDLGSQWLVNPHGNISKVCGAYVSFVNDLRSKLHSSVAIEQLAPFPLYEYANLHWEFHVRLDEGHMRMVDLALMDEQIELTSQDLMDSTAPGYFSLRQKYPDVRGLHLVACGGLTRLIPQFLEKYDIDGIDGSGKTPILYAIGNDHEALACLLIEKGADINQMDKSGRPIIFCAILHRLEAVACLLIEKGVDVNQVDVNRVDIPRRTVLVCAIMWHQWATARLLIEKGADVNQLDESGQSLIFCAIKHKQEAVACLLIEKGVNINQLDQSGQTLVDQAVNNGQESMIRLLAKKGANLDEMNKLGQTALHRAINKHYYKGVEQLVRSGASLEAPDINGRTPLLYAMDLDDVDRIYALTSMGASLMTPDHNGRTPLSVAIKSTEVWQPISLARGILQRSKLTVETFNDMVGKLKSPPDSFTTDNARDMLAKITSYNDIDLLLILAKRILELIRSKHTSSIYATLLAEATQPAAHISQLRRVHRGFNQ